MPRAALQATIYEELRVRSVCEDRLEWFLTTEVRKSGKVVENLKDNGLKVSPNWTHLQIICYSPTIPDFAELSWSLSLAHSSSKNRYLIFEETAWSCYC